MSAIMAADDIRHGTEAGHEQHLRDGHNPCHACYQAKLIAARRRNKRKTQGYVYKIPAGMAHQRVIQWLASGATQEDICRHTGLIPSVIHRVYHGGPDQMLYTRTWNAIISAPKTMPLTSVGAVRRVQALTALGYSLPAIARETGIHHDTILDARAGNTRVIAMRVREAIAEAYDRLEVTIPVGESSQQRAGISRARNLARRNGWPPPIVWEQIDDALEQPTDWAYTPADRGELVDDMLQSGATLSDVLRHLKINAEALEKWMDRTGRRAAFNRLLARERGVA